MINRNDNDNSDFIQLDPNLIYNIDSPKYS